MGLDSAFNWLTFADSHMETWMNEFNMDSLKDNQEEQVKYLESGEKKISQVNEEMISSLHKSRFFIAEKIVNWFESSSSLPFFQIIDHKIKTVFIFPNQFRRKDTFICKKFFAIKWTAAVQV